MNKVKGPSFRWGIIDEIEFWRDEAEIEKYDDEFGAEDEEDEEGEGDYVDPVTGYGGRRGADFEIFQLEDEMSEFEGHVADLLAKNEPDTLVIGSIDFPENFPLESGGTQKGIYSARKSPNDVVYVTVRLRVPGMGGDTTEVSGKAFTSSLLISAVSELL